MSSSNTKSVISQKASTGAFYTFSSNQTRISFPWPEQLTGLERIACSAKGDLQRVLSAFFARPISIATVYSNTYYHTSTSLAPVPLTVQDHPSAIANASTDLPVIQRRQVYLQCSDKIVCTATSTVRITSPESAHYFLEEKYAIGQMFARMGKAPEFDLLSVGLGAVPSSEGENVTPPSTEKTSFLRSRQEQQQIWRKYKLSVADFECEILEVFPSRDMFVAGAQWLDADNTIGNGPATHDWALSKAEDAFNTAVQVLHSSRSVVRPQTGVVLFFGMVTLLITAFELSMFFTGKSFFC
ncbi:hypothetical protein DXG03_004183 [Asterophora parasitica]|uniref:Uncharacterized protein n=1 Tax=Asterophora parasitica TaxID=117018 RepID=A0A9P7G6W5_9AGAR|nr:hypothetical protein DXG03_004183 [Asterophora parasitica]